MAKNEQNIHPNGMPTDPLAQRLRELGRIGVGAGALVLAWSIVTEMSEMQEFAVATLSNVLQEDMQSSQVAIKSLMDVLNVACKPLPLQHNLSQLP